MAPIEIVGWYLVVISLIVIMFWCILFIYNYVRYSFEVYMQMRMRDNISRKRQAYENRYLSHVRNPYIKKRPAGASQKKEGRQTVVDKQ